MTPPGGHPTDADREARAAPTLVKVMMALHTSNGRALAELLRGDAAWLSPEGRLDGQEAAHRAVTVATSGRAWADPQVKGAHAVLRWSDPEGGQRGALVVEVRGSSLVLVCEAP